jgi:hypothetical protein
MAENMGVDAGLRQQESDRPGDDQAAWYTTPPWDSAEYVTLAPVRAHECARRDGHGRGLASNLYSAPLHRWSNLFLARGRPFTRLRTPPHEPTNPTLRPDGTGQQLLRPSDCSYAKNLFPNFAGTPPAPPPPPLPSCLKRAQSPAARTPALLQDTAEMGTPGSTHGLWPRAGRGGAPLVSEIEVRGNNAIIRMDDDDAFHRRSHHTA